MTKYPIHFSLCIHVGSSEIPEALSGTIEVNLYADPKDDEINCWRIGQRHPVFDPKVEDQIDRLAIEQARQQLAADQAETAIAKTSAFCG